MKKYFSKLFIIQSVYALIIGTFFTIFVYRVTGNIVYALSVLMIRYGGYLVGFLLSAFLSNKYRISDLLSGGLFINAILYILMGLLFTENIIAIVLFVFVQSIIWSLFYTGMNLIHQNYLLDLFDTESLLVRLRGVVVIIGIIIPVVVGIIAEEFGYQLLFILFGIYLLTQVFANKNLQVLEKSEFTVNEFRKLLASKGVVPYSLLLVFINYISILRNFSMVLVGFLLLAESEKNLGLVITIAALISGVVGIFFSKTSTKKKHFIAHGGGALHAIGNIIIVALWNGLGFTIRSIIAPIADIFYDPVLGNSEVRIRQKILGKNSEVEGLEFLTLREIILFISRFLAFGTMLIGMYLVNDYLLLSRWIFGVLVLWPSIQLMLYLYFEKRILAKPI